MNENKILKKCLNCETVITRYSTRCQKCAAFERSRDSEYLKKQRQIQTGQKRSVEARNKMSLSQKNRFKDPSNHPNFGKRGLVGKNNGMFKDGRTPLVISLRHSSEYVFWRDSIFKRDNYTCQDCNKVGGNLEAHHIKSFSLIFEEFMKQYSYFNIVEDKEILFVLACSYKPLWDINNGKTVCEDCHKSNYTTRP